MAAYCRRRSSTAAGDSPVSITTSRSSVPSLKSVKARAWASAARVRSTGIRATCRLPASARWRIISMGPGS